MLIDALRQALVSARRPEATAELQPLADSGLAHWHLRLVGSGLLARIPKQSQLGLDAAAHLAYEAACFERAAASGHTPGLVAVLPPSAALPRGALLVHEVYGRPLRLPQDLPALVQALAALHALPLPAAPARAPLEDPADALADLAHEVDTQAGHLHAAGLHPDSHARIDAERQRLRTLLAQGARPARRFTAFDAHPGNFIVDTQGRAWLVDLEKARYGAAAADLAHATQYTSTTWDLASHAVLDDVQVLAASQAWLQALGDPGEQAWVVPLRRAMALWSLTWCAKWRVQSGRGRGEGAEDWSAELSEAALVAHVHERVDHYLSPAIVARVFDGADTLAQALQRS